ncbi:uncharacterized protein V6R79_012123 [Siganus canaliculatus]
MRADSAMESLEKQLSCPICLDMFNKPVVILPCQHNLCRGCANDLYESKNPYHYSGGTFRCPTCRFDVVLDRHGVYGLQRNLLVENIIDMYKQQLENPGVGGDEPPLKDKDAQGPKCQEHEDERINIYCLSCQTPTCSMCKVFGQHKDCQVAPLHDVYQSQKSELRAAMELLAAGNSCVQAAVAQMDETCKLVQEHGEQRRRRLGESFDLLYAILEERKGQLLEQVGQVEQDKVAALRNMADQYRQQLQSGRQLQETLSQSLQTSSAAQFLLTSRQLQDQARQASLAAHVQRPEPGFESLEHLSLDTREAETLLRSMAFSREEGQ